jgi:hypothetical protein
MKRRYESRLEKLSSKFENQLIGGVLINLPIVIGAGLPVLINNYLAHCANSEIYKEPQLILSTMLGSVGAGLFGNCIGKILKISRKTGIYRKMLGGINK